VTEERRHSSVLAFLSCFADFEVVERGRKTGGVPIGKTCECEDDFSFEDKKTNHHALGPAIEARPYRREILKIEAFQRKRSGTSQEKTAGGWEEGEKPAKRGKD
jgi:hypothetical protein